MKNYIILAYPNKNGISYAAFEAIHRGLQESGQEVRVLDLYEEEFNPVLYFDEHNKRRNLYLEEETRKYREDIQWADRIVFVYPTWWSGMPAILKGYIDRVFALQFAYRYKGIFPIGLLKGKQAWILTTFDAPMVASYFMQDYGKVLKRQVLNLCGIKVSKQFALASTKRTSLKKREAWLDKLYKYAKTH